jgi:hypothetical protein
VVAELARVLGASVPERLDLDSIREAIAEQHPDLAASLMSESLVARV